MTTTHPLLDINAPSDLIDHWWADGDLRRPGSDWSDDNYRYTDAVLAAARAEGLTVTADSESACSFFYGDERTLKRLVEIVGEVVPAMWAESAQAN